MAERDQPRVVVTDDGELLLVREMLSELGIAHEDGALAPEGGEDRRPAALLITSPRRALSPARTPARLHLVVYDDVSKTLQKALARSGCDIALQSPLDAAVLRMIVERAMYRGPERRTRRRAIVASPIKVKSGLRQADATLGQLSARGCGLVLGSSTSTGKTLVLTLPEELTRAKPLKLEASVIACKPVANEHGRFEAWMRFQKIGGAEQRMLEQIIGRHAAQDGNPAASQPREAEEEEKRAPSKPAASRAPTAAPATEDVGADRRKHPRKVFKSQLLATGDSGSHLLFGCDLSTGGMRVRHDSSLKLGDRLKLAVYARKGLPSVMLQALVAHEGDDGSFGLSFVDVPKKLAGNLEQLVDALPPLPASPGAKPSLVVSQVLEQTEAEE